MLNKYRLLNLLFKFRYFLIPSMNLYYHPLFPEVDLAIVNETQKLKHIILIMEKLLYL